MRVRSNVTTSVRFPKHKRSVSISLSVKPYLSLPPSLWCVEEWFSGAVCKVAHARVLTLNRDLVCSQLLLQ